ncbi:MAG TPA: hypothetical protein VN633_08535 [Bryobacteraceae bacterium]|jgi:hypothetical protein|nr:hypothetical protein [Bryobacteraceae bacterium]
MKKRNQSAHEPIVPEQILEMAKKSIESDRPVKAAKHCAVCGSDYTPMSGPQQPEELCWVCRRLKISAWRDVDQQAAATE